MDPIQANEVRSCGECTLCCKLVSVEERGEVDGQRYEFTKRAGEWCKHACASGCAVHGSDPPARPKQCGDFKCLWLLGYFRERHRPDRARVVPCYQAGQLPDGTVVHYFIVYESWPGCALDGRGREVLDMLRKQFSDPVLVIHRARGERTVYYPGKPGERVAFTGDPDRPGA